MNNINLTNYTTKTKLSNYVNKTQIDESYEINFDKKWILLILFYY